MAAKQFTPASLQQSFRGLLQPYMLRLDDAKESLIHGMNARVRQERTHVRGLTDSLTALSPQKVLERGYAVVRTQEGGTVISDAESVETGSAIRVTFSHSELEADVTKRSSKGMAEQ
jgi:exodeoxyribonuclease VII large subunit